MFRHFTLKAKLSHRSPRSRSRSIVKKGAEYLIIVTKYPPEVSDRRLRQLGAYALRWQGIHRALLDSQPTAHIDRFIRSTFTKFLEELGMAHAADLTLKDVKTIQGTLIKLRSDKRKYFVPKDSFSLADALLDFMAM